MPLNNNEKYITRLTAYLHESMYIDAPVPIDGAWNLSLSHSVSLFSLSILLSLSFYMQQCMTVNEL